MRRDYKIIRGCLSEDLYVYGDERWVRCGGVCVSYIEAFGECRGLPGVGV